MNEEMKMFLTSLNSFFLLLVDFILRKIGFLIKYISWPSGEVASKNQQNSEPVHLALTRTGGV